MRFWELGFENQVSNVRHRGSDVETEAFWLKSENYWKLVARSVLTIIVAGKPRGCQKLIRSGLEAEQSEAEAAPKPSEAEAEPIWAELRRSQARPRRTQAEPKR